MKVVNASTNLELERDKGLFHIRLESTQFKEGALQELFENVIIKEDDEGCSLSYSVPEKAQSLTTAIQKTKSRLDKLKLAQKLANLSDLQNQFSVPFLHPENLLLEGERLFVVHFGLRNLIAPYEITTDEFLKSYKALIFYIFNSKNSFESLLSGGNSSGDKLTQAINKFDELPEIIKFIDQEVQKEAEKERKRFAFVPRGRYAFFKYFGSFAIVLALGLVFLTYSYYNNSKKQEAIITGQTSFLTDNYAQTQKDLSSYPPGELPKSARYILAVSSINLSDLTLTQKQDILNNISIKSDDNTLNYWLHTGRGNFDDALNLALNLGDNQLTLFAYTNLYESTKLNTTMDGAEKQKLLEEYNEKIQELIENLGR